MNLEDRVLAAIRTAAGLVRVWQDSASGNLVKLTCGAVVDEAANLVFVGDERVGLDAGYGLANILLQVSEGFQGKGRAQAGIGFDSVFDIIVPKGQHPAVRVVDQRNFPGAQQALGNDQRADCIVADHAARVANHVCVAFLESQYLMGVQASVHAGYNRQLTRWGQGQVAFVETLGVAGVVGKKFVYCSHRG